MPELARGKITQVIGPVVDVEFPSGHSSADLRGAQDQQQVH